MNNGTIIRIAAVVAASAALLLPAGPVAGQAGGNAQLLWGSDFRDVSVGNATSDGHMGTLTLEHFGAWALGDHFFFIDFTTGTFEAENRGYHMYSEWTPRLSLGRALDRSVGAGPVRDVLLVGEVQAGSGGYAAGLIGPGVDLAVPGFDLLSLSLLRRDDSFNPATWQASAVWSIGLPLGVEGRFAGFMDVVGSPTGDPTVMTQPQLLFEVGPLVGTARRDLQVGVEWYLHSDGTAWHSVPQALVRWAW